MPTRILANPGNYRKLLSYRKAEAIYDLTFWFCGRYLAKGDRTIDQMVQAARSGKQNIAEGSAASATSSETEIKLLNVAKASLKELLEDYADWLRVHGKSRWPDGSPELEAMRRLGREHDAGAFFVELARSRTPETAANMAIVLLNQADYILARQLRSLEKAFVESGGIRERMHALRCETRAAMWETSALDALSLAESPSALAARLSEMHAALDRLAARVREKRGWGKGEVP